MPRTVIGSNAVLFVPDATRYHFGVLSSAMHMAWVRQVCGRLESRYRYSNKLVYNNYPWPESPNAKQRSAVKAAAKAVLDARAPYLKRGATLAELYDPLATPAKVVNAHTALDRTVDRCYRAQPFTSERQRVEFLFALYEKLTSPLLPAAAKKKRPRK
jgi:endonuclease/exonuclease/phosphatase family metal-dependent hydrolase